MYRIGFRFAGHRKTRMPTVLERHGKSIRQGRSELTAAFLCAEFNMEGNLRHAGYLASWLKLLKDDNRAFFTACRKAQAAADYLRGKALADPEAIAA